MLKIEISMNQIKISVQIFICRLNQVVKNYSGLKMYHYIQIMKRKQTEWASRKRPWRRKANSGKEKEPKQMESSASPSLVLLAFSSTALSYLFCSLIPPLLNHSAKQLFTEDSSCPATLWNTSEVTRNKWPQEPKLLLHRFQSKRDNDWKEWNY